MTESLLLGVAIGMVLMQLLEISLFPWLAHLWATQRRVRARVDGR